MPRPGGATTIRNDVGETFSDGYTIEEGYQGVVELMNSLDEAVSYLDKSLMDHSEKLDAILIGELTQADDSPNKDPLEKINLNSGLAQMIIDSKYRVQRLHSRVNNLTERIQL